MGAREAMGMRIGIVVWVAMMLACVERSVDESPPGDDEASDGEEIGERPDDGMYSECEDFAECAPLDFCVFPADEVGYCTTLCAEPDDPSGCDASPGGSAVPSCLRLSEENRVCALDCSGGKSCPDGMRCEGIDTAEGERRVCF